MKKYIPSINGLRALSIAFVLFSHVRYRNFGIYDSPGGQIGVTIFFLISGYLITLLLINEEEKNNSISLKSFFFRRVIRIFPVYYFLLLTYFLLQSFSILHFSNESWITSLTYTKYFNLKNGNEWESGHFWSLSIEEHFYLIWPFIFKYQKKTRVLFAFLIILLITSIRLFTDINDLNILTRVDAIMIGCLFAFYNSKLQHVVLNIKNRLYLIIPFCLLILFIVFKRILNIAESDINKHLIKAFIGSFGLFTDMAIGFIIIISINFKNNIWFKFLNNKIVNYVGILSYSIYIWQQLFFSFNLDLYSKFPINLFFIFIVANISYYLIEKPFLKLKQKSIKIPIVKEIYNVTS